MTAGAVPEDGIAINLTSMRRFTLISDYNETPRTAAAEPGVLLCHLQEELKTHGLFFPPDPTETTASIGGMIACNSSGARSYAYGSVRNHIQSLDMILADGDKLHLRRGQCMAEDGRFALTTESGRKISGSLPDIPMPAVKKCTAGYYIRPNMDMVDLLIGSEGTLGIVTRAELSLREIPPLIAGAVVFLPEESCALELVHLVRRSADVTANHPIAIEFFGCDTLGMLRDAQGNGEALSDMPRIPQHASCAVYLEYNFGTDNASLDADNVALSSAFSDLGAMIRQSGGSPEHSWVALGGADMQRLKDFRHAAPVTVNARIREIRKAHSGITKLGTDMSVPDSRLNQIFAMYRRDLASEGFSSSLFGHIGNNHLHVNIIPKDPEEYARGKELYSRWAQEVVRVGGSVSAEHGIGKLKIWLLQKQYTPEQLHSMYALKLLFDPYGRLNPGNIFPDQR